MRSQLVSLVALVLVGAGCADGSGVEIDFGVDSGGDMGVGDAGSDAETDAGADLGNDLGSDLGTDAGHDGGGPSCLLDHMAGDRYPAGDDCNFCDCGEDGVATCTTRMCDSTAMSCTYGGTLHRYGERFTAPDGCNECACAASGAACTQRDCAPLITDAAILLENDAENCGDVPGFTVQSVLGSLPYFEFDAPFLYQRDRELYPETDADTTVHVNIAYEDGIAACRIPMPGQEAIDLEVTVEVITADGKFNEGFHAYLRRDRMSMVDWYNLAMSSDSASIEGTYSPSCFDFNGFTFGINIYGDGTAEGQVGKVCESDILLDVATFNYTGTP